MSQIMTCAITPNSVPCTSINRNKSKFRLSDLQASLLALETTMPVHCCVVDYLTLMYPLESERGYPQRADYNDLIKAFKNLLITHRDIRGNVAPMLGITAHQISRHGFDACVKADGRYDVTAFTDYSEIEKSAEFIKEVESFLG